MKENTKFTPLAKAWLIVILAFMSALAPLSTDMYLPALKNVEASFATDAFYAQLSITLFFVGFAFGQLIYGPLSDIFGRKIPLIGGVAFFILSSLGCIMVDNVSHFILLRFFEALGGCAGVVIARAIVNDLFDFKEAGSVYAVLMVVGSLAPMLAPSVGGFMLGIFSWESIFITLFVLGVILLLLVKFTLKESNENKKKFSFSEIKSNYLAVLSDKIFVFYTLAMSFTFSAMFIYITSANPVFIGHFGLGEQIFGHLFGVNSLGFMISSIINARLIGKFHPHSIMKFGFFTMMSAAILMIIFGKIGNFWGFEISLFFAIAMNGFIIPTITTLSMSRQKAHSGTASAILGFMQFSLAGLGSFMAGALGVTNPLFLGIAMLISIAIGVVIFLFFVIKSENKTI